MKGIIYCIKELSSEKVIYIGSTINLKHRISTHKYDCFTSNDDSLLYNYIRSKSTRENFYEFFTFEIILETEVKNRKELFMIENEYISRSSDKTFNKIGSFFTIEDNKKCNVIYYEKNKEKLLSYQKEYNLNNKDKIRKYKAAYYEKNKEKIKAKTKENTKKRKTLE